MHVSNQIPKTFQIGTKNKIKKIWYYQSTYYMYNQSHYFRMIAFLVLNIIASIFATLFLIVPESIGVAFFAGSSYYEGVVNVFHLYCIMLIVGLVQALTSIVAAGYSCSAICCGENQNYPGMVIYSPSLASNTNQSHFVPQVFQASTTPENFFSPQNNPHTATDSTFAEVSLDAQKVNENEKNDHEGM